MSGSTTQTKQATSSSTSEPWAAQKPYLLSGFDAAKSLWNQPGPAYFPDSTIAGFNPLQTQAQNMVIDRATAGSPLLGQADQYTSDVLSGKYLNSNPYGDSVFNNISSHVVPQTTSTALSQGWMGGNGATDALTRALTEAYSPWASQNYQFGQNQMMDMAKYAPDLAMRDYQDAGALDVVGQQRQGLAQQEIQDAQNRWNYYQQLPYNKLSDYMGIVGGANWGGTSTTSTPYQAPTTFGSILGAGSSLLGSALLGGIFG